MQQVEITEKSVATSVTENVLKKKRGPQGKHKVKVKVPVNESEVDKIVDDILEEEAVVRRIAEVMEDKHRGSSSLFRHYKRNEKYNNIQTGVSQDTMIAIMDREFKKMSTLRTLHELLTEIKDGFQTTKNHPYKPKRKSFWPSRYLLHEKRDKFTALAKKIGIRPHAAAYKAYGNLNPLLKRKYINLADAARKKHGKAVEEFKAQHSDFVSTSYQLPISERKLAACSVSKQAYVRERMKDLGDVQSTLDRAAAEWAKFSEDERLIYIHKALKNAYLAQLTKRELKIYFTSKGLPRVKVYPNACRLYLNDYAAEAAKRGHPKRVPYEKRWVFLPAETKEHYIKLAEHKKTEFISQCTNFLKNMTPEELIIYQLNFCEHTSLPGIPKMNSKMPYPFYYFLKDRGVSSVRNWKELSSIERRTYKEAALEARKEYEQTCLNAGLDPNKNCFTMQKRRIEQRNQILTQKRQARLAKKQQWKDEVRISGENKTIAEPANTLHLEKAQEDTINVIENQENDFVMVIEKPSEINESTDTSSIGTVDKETSFSLATAEKRMHEDDSSLVEEDQIRKRQKITTSSAETPSPIPSYTENTVITESNTLKEPVPPPKNLIYFYWTVKNPNLQKHEVKAKLKKLSDAQINEYQDELDALYEKFTDEVAEYITSLGNDKQKIKEYKHRMLQLLDRKK